LGKSSSGFIKSVKLPPIQRELSEEYVDQKGEGYVEQVITVPNCQ